MEGPPRTSFSQLPHFNEELSVAFVIRPTDATKKNTDKRDKDLMWTRKEERPYRSRLAIATGDRPQSRRESKMRHSGCHQCAVLDDQYEARSRCIMHEQNGPKRTMRALTCPRMRFAVLAWIARDLHRQMSLYDSVTPFCGDYAPGPYIRSQPVYEPWDRFFCARYGNRKVGTTVSGHGECADYYDKLASIFLSAAAQHGAQ